MLYSEIPLYVLRSTQNTQTHCVCVCVQNVELLNVKLVVHIVTTGTADLRKFQ